MTSTELWYLGILVFVFMFGIYVGWAAMVMKQSKPSALHSTRDSKDWWAGYNQGMYCGKEGFSLRLSMHTVPIESNKMYCHGFAYALVQVWGENKEAAVAIQALLYAPSVNPTTVLETIK